MKIRTKTILSDYNEDTGLSYVVIATDIGEFEGYAQLHEEDKEVASHYAGCRYAEMRAGIKYMKAKAKIADYKLQPLYRIYNDLKQRRSFYGGNIGVKLLEKEIYKLEDERQSFIDYATTLTERLNEAITSRPEVLEKIKQRKEKQDNE